MPVVARGRLSARSGLLALGALLIATLAGVDPAAAVELNVSPKNERVMFRAFDGKISPKSHAYKLWASGGAKVKWQLKSSPNWLVPDATKGTATADKQTLKFKVNAAKAAKRDPGIYTKPISFTYTNAGKTVTVRRNATLIVEGTPSKGQKLFVNRCIGCHDLNVNMSGPRLGDVYGRVAGTAPGFSYSTALKAYGKVWEERNLNDWLTNPQALVPDANMFLKVKKPVDRMNIIAYLKAISP